MVNFSIEKNQFFLLAKNKLVYKLTSMHGQALIAGDYSVQLKLENNKNIACDIFENGKKLASTFKDKGETKILSFSSNGGNITMELRRGGEIRLQNLVVIKN